MSFCIDTAKNSPIVAAPAPMRRSRRESAPFLLPGFFVGILAAFLLALNAVQVDARMTREEITFIVWYD